MHCFFNICGLHISLKYTWLGWSLGFFQGKISYSLQVFNNGYSFVGVGILPSHSNVGEILVAKSSLYSIEIRYLPFMKMTCRGGPHKCFGVLVSV